MSLKRINKDWIEFKRVNRQNVIFERVKISNIVHVEVMSNWLGAHVLIHGATPVRFFVHNAQEAQEIVDELFKMLNE